MITSESWRTLLPWQTPHGTPAELGGLHPGSPAWLPLRRGCRDAQDVEMPEAWGRAPATANTCGFGLRTLTPGASSKENLGLEVDMGTTDGSNILQMDALAKRLSLPHHAEFPHVSKSWTELIWLPPPMLSVINLSAPHATAASPWKRFDSLLTLPQAINWQTGS